MTIGVETSLTQRCRSCREDRPISDYYVSCRDGVMKICKTCQKVASAAWGKANPESRKKSSREYAARNRNRCRGYLDKWKYGVDPTFRFELWTRQSGRCAICSTTITAESGCLDHDHVTGRIRGMLCHPCNKGLGAFRDSPETLQHAAAYLRGDK